MSTTYPDSYQVKFCSFPPSFNTNSQYVCFKYERCCPQGCCYSYSYTYFQSWYFWLVVVLLFLIFYAASWYCKKLDIERRSQRQSVATSSRLSSAQNSPRRNEGNVDHLLECLMQTYTARNVLINNQSRRLGDKTPGPPPKYNDALNMPKVDRSSVQVEVHVNGNTSTASDGGVEVENPPPTYDDATKPPNGD